uniref:Uncharacterized protein n=1 Tax=Globisporangium ultimum (strain ATCC 200006 / CBS 805.95 / DAOM BR144) TaxID=431595 RepID=K3X337_GLOUD
MTGPRQESSRPNQQQIVCASLPSTHSWLRKLHLAGHSRSKKQPPQCFSDNNNSSSSSAQDLYALVPYPSCTSIDALEPQHKRKQPSFLRALFKPHEHKAVSNASRKQLTGGQQDNQIEDSAQQQDNNTKENEIQHVVPPVEIPGMYMGRGRISTVGGKHVPFTRDAHYRKKKGVKLLPRIAEGHAVSTLGSMSMEAYRSRAYYPAKKQSKVKR